MLRGRPGGGEGRDMTFATTSQLVERWIASRMMSDRLVDGEGGVFEVIYYSPGCVKSPSFFVGELEHSCPPR